MGILKALEAATKRTNAPAYRDVMRTARPVYADETRGPEECEVEVIVSGGGDSALTEVHFRFGESQPPDVTLWHDADGAVTKLRLTMHGEWERDGLAKAFEFLAAELRRG